VGEPRHRRPWPGRSTAGRQAGSNASTLPRSLTGCWQRTCRPCPTRFAPTCCMGTGHLAHSIASSSVAPTAAPHTGASVVRAVGRGALEQRRGHARQLRDAPGAPGGCWTATATSRGSTRAARTRSLRSRQDGPGRLLVVARAATAATTGSPASGRRLPAPWRPLLSTASVRWPASSTRLRRATLPSPPGPGAARRGAPRCPAVNRRSFMPMSVAGCGPALTPRARAAPSPSCRRARRRGRPRGPAAGRA